ncbi:unnamed protein product [Somion occarium]
MRSASLTTNQLAFYIEEQEKLVKELNAKRIKHNLYIAALKGRCNATASPINSLLPVDVLSEIFMHLVLTWSESARPYSWFKVAHVCRYWRDVVFSSSRFFSYIRVPTANREHGPEWLRLARNCRLHLHISDETCNTGGMRHHMWEEVLPHLAHTQSLLLQLHKPNHKEYAWPRCSMLTNLTWLTSSVVSPTCVKDAFDAMPNLQILETSTGTLGPDWTRYSLPSTITTLRVNHAKSVSYGIMEELFTRLHSLPSLKHLDLHGLSRNDYSANLSPRRCYSLYRLETLTLHGAMTPCFDVLNRVDLICNFDLDLYPDSPNDVKNIVSLPAILLAKLRGGSDDLPLPLLRTCAFEGGRMDDAGHWVMNLRGWPFEVPSEFPCTASQGPYGPPLLSLAFSLDLEDEEFFDVVCSLLVDLRPLLEQTQRLKIAYDVTGSSSHVFLQRVIFSHLKHVRSLQTALEAPGFDPAEDDVPISQLPSQLHPVNDDGSPLLPQLRELYIAPEEVCPEFDSSFWVHLENDLRTRKSIDLQVDVLVLDMMPWCYLPNHDWQSQRVYIENCLRLSGS